MLKGNLRRIVLWGLSGAFLAAIGANLRAQDGQEQASLVIDITGFENQSGHAAMLLLDSKKAFDVVDMRGDRKDWEKVPRDLVDLKISKSGKGFAVKHRIENLKPGEYVVLAFHDRNKNGKLDSNLIGMPKEPFGMSNNFRPQLLPIPQHPTWAKLAFLVRPGENKIAINVRD